MIFWKYEEYMLEIIIVLALLTTLLWLRESMKVFL